MFSSPYKSIKVTINFFFHLIFLLNQYSPENEKLLKIDSPSGHGPKDVYEFVSSF